MRSYFDIEKLNHKLKEFYTITQIRITVFDTEFKEITGYPMERSEICNFLRKNPIANNDCIKCDQVACLKASEMKDPYIYLCHAGLTEIIYPLYIGNIVIGYLLFAHILSFDSKEDAYEVIHKNCLKYDLDNNMLKDLCYQAPLISRDFLIASSHLLQVVATYLCMEKYAYLRYDDLALKIDNYILTNYMENLHVEKICKEFNIGKTQLYNISKALYNEGIAERIKNIRLNNAKEMLINDPYIEINEVVYQCGFNDYNYFIALFKQKFGLPPKKYAKNHRQII